MLLVMNFVNLVSVYTFFVRSLCILAFAYCRYTSTVNKAQRQKLDFLVFLLNCSFPVISLIPKNILDETCTSYEYNIYMTMNVDLSFMKNWVSVTQN